MFYSSFFSSSLQMPCRRSSYRVECEKKTINMRLRSFFLVLSSVSSTSSSSQLSFSIWIHEDQPLASHFESTKNRTNHFQTKAKCATNEQIYIWKKEPFFSLSLRTKHFYFASSFSQWLSASARDRDIEIGSVRLFDKSQAHDSEHQRTRYTAITYCFFIQWHNC